jgi:hypothetical protein
MEKKFVPPIALSQYTHTTHTYNSFFISYHLSVAFFEDDKFRHDSPWVPRRQLCNVHELASIVVLLRDANVCEAINNKWHTHTHTHSLSRVYIWKGWPNVCVCVCVCVCMYAVISEYNERIHRIRFSRLTPLCACIGGGSHVMHESWAKFQ